MAINRVKLAPGLYFIATPIGSARDITLRSLDILASADHLYCEDTRSLRKLMDIHGVPLGARRVSSYHEHSAPAVRERILNAIANGESIAYASEAGTPLIADPGYQLGRHVIDAGHMVTAAPGASAVLTALTVSGLGTDKFFFAGFPPTSKSSRKTFFTELRDIPGTLVFYESPKRIHATFEALEDVYGPNRQAVLARELTKKFEEVIRGTTNEIATELAGRTIKGECVVLVARATAGDTSEDIDQMIVDQLQTALASESLKDAVSAVSSALGQPRRKVYQAALALSKDANGG